MAQKVKRSHRFCITRWDDWDEQTWKDTFDFKKLFDEYKPYTYISAGLEICPTTGRKHVHVYLECQNARYETAIRKVCKGSHVEIAKGPPEKGDDYVKEDGRFAQDGQLKQQGRRVDLEKLRDQVYNEGKKVDEIAIELPNMYHQYGRTLNKIEDLAMRKNYRTEMTKGIWYWGETGVGKSHKAFEGYSPETHYVLPNDNGWWDSYIQQDTVIINDFRGEIPYNQLLNLVDKWPFSVKRRNREPMPFISKTVIITSSLPPDRVYHNRVDEDKIEQLMRRFTIVHLQNSAV